MKPLLPAHDPDSGSSHLSGESRESRDTPAAGATVSRWRAGLVHGSLVLFALAIIAKSAQIQIVEREKWARLASSQQVKEEQIEPPRGRIHESTGNVLVETRELMKLAIVPRNVKPYRPRRRRADTTTVNTALVIRQTLKSLQVPDMWIRRAMDTSRAWVQLPMEFLPSDLERLAGLPGIYRTRVQKRMVSATPGLLGILGRVNSAGKPLDGLELELDSVLLGAAGRQLQVLDGRGNRLETPALLGQDARPGHDVTLTINQSLQGIAEQELLNGVARTGATGGDVVIMDARDGAVLALASVRERKISFTAMAMAEPYEPGSVMKPIVVARALQLKRVRPDEQINTESGLWTVAKRSITDEHRAPFMSVRDVIRLSSNVGAVKIAMRLSEQEEYEALRDFGFGTATGVPYPAESRGRLPVPKWHPQMAASLAMGYGVSATPLQLASAYAALANGGELLQPVFVREIRDAGGEVLYAHERRVVRRVLDEETARDMRTMLSSVVDSGTAVAAALATYEVAGKSGTARRSTAGAYNRSDYNSTFAGMFPAQEPQFVLVVRLMDPQGKIFGGTVAGRVVNVILQAAIATRDGELDRQALTRLARPLPTRPVRPRSAATLAAAFRDSLRYDSLRAPTPPPPVPVAAPARVIVTLPLSPKRSGSATKSRADASVDGSVDASLRAVPSVFGLNTRQAVRTLHAAGFRVRVAAGAPGRTRPEAGVLAKGGSMVLLEMPE